MFYVIGNGPLEGEEIRINKLGVNIELFVRKKLRKLVSFDEIKKFHSEIDSSVSMCKACKEAFAPHFYEIEVTDSQIKIVGAKNVPGKYPYCYGDGKKCKETRKDRKTLNPNSANFISIMKDMTLDEARIWIKQNNKSPFYRENYKSDEDYKTFQTRDADFYCNRFNLTKEEADKKVKLTTEKCCYARSLDGHIQKYGKLEGEAKYFKYLEAKSFKQSKYATSKWSLKIIDKIKKELPATWEIKFGTGKEFKIRDLQTKRQYSYDMYIRTDSFQKIVEFNGNKFHADPRLLTEDEKSSWYSPYNSKITWYEMKEFDEKKKMIAESLDISVLYVWDFEKEKDVIRKIKEFLYA